MFGVIPLTRFFNMTIEEKIIDKKNRTHEDGTVLASIAEMHRYRYLLHLQRSSQISDLKTQVEFVLQESFENKYWGMIEPIIYVADFVYINIDYRSGLEGKVIVEDSKGGVLTTVYKIKKKLLLKRYPEMHFFEV